MPLIHENLLSPFIQRNEDQQFLYETSVVENVSDVVNDIVAVHELLLRLNEIKQHGTPIHVDGGDPCSCESSIHERNLYMP